MLSTSDVYFQCVLFTAKSLKRTSVFERLGSESKMDTVMANKVRIVIFFFFFFICPFVLG